MWTGTAGGGRSTLSTYWARRNKSHHRGNVKKKKFIVFIETHLTTSLSFSLQHCPGRSTLPKGATTTRREYNVQNILYAHPLNLKLSLCFWPSFFFFFFDIKTLNLASFLPFWDLWREVEFPQNLNWVVINSRFVVCKTVFQHSSKQLK